MTSTSLHTRLLYLLLYRKPNTQKSGKKKGKTNWLNPKSKKPEPNKTVLLRLETIKNKILKFGIFLSQKVNSICNKFKFICRKKKQKQKHKPTLNWPADMEPTKVSRNLTTIKKKFCSDELLLTNDIVLKNEFYKFMYSSFLIA